MLLEKYGCYVGILSLVRDGSTGPTQHLLRLIRIKVQLFGENLEKEKKGGKKEKWWQPKSFLSQFSFCLCLQVRLGAKTADYQ